MRIRKKRRSATQLAVTWRRFKKNKTGLIGLGIIAFFIILAILEPFITFYPPRSFQALYEGKAGLPPFVDWSHPLGTESSGIDVYSEIIHSIKYDLYVGVSATLIAVALGVFIGGLSGFFGGKKGEAVLVLIQTFLTIPALLLILMFARILSVLVYKGMGLTLIVLILGFFGWAGIALIVRGEILKIKELEFIQAEKCLGASSFRILFRHIVPNILTPVIVIATLDIAGFILTEVVISFLGFGDPNTPTWGLLLQEGFVHARTEWWVSLFPGLAVVLAVLGFNLLGDGLNDALNPRLRER